MPDLPAPDDPAVQAVCDLLWEQRTWLVEGNSDWDIDEVRGVVAAVRQADARAERERRESLHLEGRDRTVQAAVDVLYPDGPDYDTNDVRRALDVTEAVLVAARLDDDEVAELAEAIEARWDQSPSLPMRESEMAALAARVAADWVRPGCPDWRALVERLAPDDPPSGVTVTEDPELQCCGAGDPGLLDPYRRRKAEHHDPACPWVAARAALDGREAGRG